MSSNTIEAVQRAQRNEQPSAAEREEAIEAADQEPTLPLDVVFELLSNERRRRVLRHLLTTTEETTLGDLAEHIAAIENDKPEQALSSSERKRVYICLYQCHLPKLDDADVIDFDSDRKTVTVAPRLEDLQPYLPSTDETSETDESWPGYYLGVSAFGLGAFALQRMAFPVDWLSGVLLGFVLAALCLIAVEHRRTVADSD